ncbi:MAG: CarD family transcriptional regulator [Nitriliruptorales bacterium]|nr:CarD family transcriptional regulator [Nitriliruptorales bacterium]
MKLKKGQTVVHPRHGTATVEDFEEREIDGEVIEYVVLRREEDRLTVRVPVEQYDEVGLRTIIEESDVDDVLSVLTEDPKGSQASWRKRHAKHEKRLKSGDPEELAVLLRELTARAETKGIPPSDKLLRDKARERLIGELAASLDRDESEVEQMVDEALDEALGTVEDE